MVLTLFTVLLLSSSSQKPEESTSTTPQTPTAVAPASPAFGNITFSPKKPESAGN